MGHSFGDPDNPLLVSVRSGSPRSMAGMMDTILNVAHRRHRLGTRGPTGDRSFAWDWYRRLIKMFSEAVMKIHRSSLDEADRQTAIVDT